MQIRRARWLKVALTVVLAMGGVAACTDDPGAVSDALNETGTDAGTDAGGPQLSWLNCAATYEEETSTRDYDQPPCLIQTTRCGDLRGAGSPLMENCSGFCIQERCYYDESGALVGGTYSISEGGESFQVGQLPDEQCVPLVECDPVAGGDDAGC